MTERKPRTTWLDIEEKFLAHAYPTVRTESIAEVLQRPLSSIYRKASQLGLRKTSAYLEAINGRFREGSGSGKDCRFKPGQTPWNKGTRFVAGGRSTQTQFRAGQKPHTWRPVGHNRITKEGYLQRKVSDTCCTRRDYVGIHHLVWRMHGRHVPDGYALVFADGDKRNFDINNLELVHRADLMRRNSVHNLPPDLKEVVDLKRIISRRINTLEKKAHGK